MAIGGINYPDPVIFENERLIFARFDGAQNPAAFNVPIYFSNSDVLENKIITGIEVKFNEIETRTTTIQTDIGFIGVSFDSLSLRSFALTLVGKNGDVVLNDYPLYNLCRRATFGKIRRTSMKIDLSKSYIRNFGLAGITSNLVIPINFFYKEKLNK